MNEILSIISLCKKAGKLLLGFDVVKQSVIDKKADGVFSVRDVSAKTKKELNFVCSSYGATVIEVPVTMDDIQKAVRKRAGVMAITDSGLTKKLIQIINAQNLEVK